MEFLGIDAGGGVTIFDLTIPQPEGRPRRERATRENRQSRCTRRLVSLLQQRTDLQGVYAPADHIAETLRWSA